MSISSEDKNLVLRIFKTQKGATWRFSLQVSDRGDSETKKNLYFEIRTCSSGAEPTKLRFSLGVAQNGKPILKMSFRKENMTTNTTYKVYIICKKMDYSKEHVCLEYWSNWIEIGSFDFDPIKTDGFLHPIEVDVTIYRCSTTTAGLLHFFNDSELTDFYLSTEEGSVDLHRAYLAARSDVFKAMLTGKWKETDTGIIEIKGIPLQTLKYFKEYLYLGTLPDYNGLLLLLVLASRYCVEDLKSECITKIALTVLPEDVYSLLDFACDWKLPELCYAVTHMTPDHVIHQSYQLKEKLEGTKNIVEKVASVTE